MKPWKRINVYKCGHESRDSQIIRGKVSCPICGTMGLAGKIVMCPNSECGVKHVVAKTVGGDFVFCEKCRPINTKKKQKEYFESDAWIPPAKNSRTVAAKILHRRRTCAMVDECLNPSSGKLIINASACANCEDYKKRASFDPIEFLSAGETFQETRWAHI